MSGRAGEGGGARAPFTAEPNVTPLIDVLLVLLVIFMLTLHRPVRRLVYAQPPVPPNDSAAAAAPPIVLEVWRGGGYALNGAPVARAALGARLAAVYEGRPVKALFVRGDRAASYQEVLEAMSVARGAGVRAIALVGGPPARW